jgi:transposase
MSRYDLTDFEWRVIEPLLPDKQRGVPRVDDRRVLNGIFWVLRSGALWRDLPSQTWFLPPPLSTAGRVGRRAR